MDKYKEIHGQVDGELWRSRWITMDKKKEIYG
jgi:hypothetical protein